jgi:perosamine synthetase
VHTFGCPADLAEILEIARRHHLYVVEDACEAIGAEYHRRKVGVYGDAGVFAFYPNKQITTGEGGAVVTNDPQLTARVKALRNQGRSDTDDWFQHSELGYNYRISEMNCALGVGQLNRIEAILLRREEIAREYDEKLRNCKNLRLPPLSVVRRRISWFVYVVRLAPHFSQMQRDWILEEMNNRGIGCGRYFAPIHLQPAYRNVVAPRDGLKVTEFAAARCLALPFFNRLKDEEMEEVCGNLEDLIQQADKFAPSGKAVSAR